MQGRLTGANVTSDFVLVNGGLQPVVPMVAGRLQRWRMAQVGFKYFVDMQVLDPATGAPAPCELWLVAKDGVYLMQVTHHFFFV